LNQEANQFAGLPVDQAQQEFINLLEKEGFVLGRERIQQSVRVHERCDTPVEYLVTNQWFIRLLGHKEAFLRVADEITWHPEHMRVRYIQWVENLHWDWLISRQRHYGVPFPIWYCDQCGAVILAEEDDLPVHPLFEKPSKPCQCGGIKFSPELDVMDTWATSSMTPQIACGWLNDPELYRRTFPMSLRPQAHEIIRTWAFYTIVKSSYHFQKPPWKDVAISGWGLAPTGAGKISKSRGGGPISPEEVFARYSADAVRYWSGSTGLGRDSVISEDKIRVGSRLVTKLWNVARFSERFLSGYKPARAPREFLPLDRWILCRLQRTVNHSTSAFENYDYVTALNETETLFWHDLADNYLEMAKYRLYGQAGPGQESARFTLYQSLLIILKLFAPILPHITEEIFWILFSESEKQPSIHSGGWPRDSIFTVDEEAESFGELMVDVVSAVRRYKSESHLPLSKELELLEVVSRDQGITAKLEASEMDLKSATRAKRVEILEGQLIDREILLTDDRVQVAISK
jgi:valyl-tRNA synthetase